MSMAVYLSPNTLDQARVLGQIITGVGFLGAGVMMTQDGKIHGVTSAAVIWVLASTKPKTAFKRCAAAFTKKFSSAAVHA